MTMEKRAKRALGLALLLGGVAAASIGIGAVPAGLLTHLGEYVEGTLTGLGPTLRLMETDGVRSIGAGPHGEIPLSSIRQITVDFPRVVVETVSRTWIGPYSAFRGLPEEVQLRRAGASTVTFPIAGLRAITLHGDALRPVPRVWLGGGHLSMPEIAAASTVDADGCEDCAITRPRASTVAPSPEDRDETPLWDALTPQVAPQESEELPWWVGLLGVAGLIAVAFLLTSTGGGSS